METMNRAPRPDEGTLPRSELLDLLDMTPDYIASAAPDLSHVYMNLGGRRLLGIGDDEPIEKLGIDDIHPPDQMEIIKTKAFPSIIEKGSWEGELEMLHRDGSRIPVWLTGFATKNPDGSLYRVGAIARDIRQLKKREDELKTRMGEIERMNKMLTDRELRMIELKNEIASLKEEVAQLRAEIEGLKNR